MANDDHMKHLRAVTMADVACLEEKERTYGGSWKRRGGGGVFMMLARKWDRLENMLGTPSRTINRSRAGKQNLEIERWDVFAHIESNTTGEDGSVLAEVRDLRRYLLLVEAEMVARGALLALPAPLETNVPSTPEDGGHHAAAQPHERYDDGLTERPPYPYITMSDGDDKETIWYITNRHVLPKEDWEHLPRLPIELTYKEWSDTVPYYRGLYDWVDNKYRMKPGRRAEWGKEP